MMGGITSAKAPRNRTKVLVAVGGATYQNFAALNTKAIAHVVKDFGFDGVDIDYEPFNNGQCSSSNGRLQSSASENTKRHQSKLSNDCTSDMSNVVTRQLPAITF